MKRCPLARGRTISNDYPSPSGLRSREAKGLGEGGRVDLEIINASAMVFRL